MRSTGPPTTVMVNGGFGPVRSTLTDAWSCSAPESVRTSIGIVSSPGPAVSGTMHCNGMRCVSPEAKGVLSACVELHADGSRASTWTVEALGFRIWRSKGTVAPGTTFVAPPPSGSSRR